MTSEKALRQTILDQIKRMVNETMNGWDYELYLFGSFASGKEVASSDIDIAIDSETPIPNHLFVELRTKLEESSIPYQVDVINLQKANVLLKEQIRKSGKRWKD